jgi:uncharacterized protein (DUF433 family)
MLRGAYPAERAASLAGVPKSTVHYWARERILVPSISAERVRLWSYPDLMGLRTIYWLRKQKTTSQGADIPATSMPAVRRALKELRELDLALWTEEGGPAVTVDGGGKIVLVKPDDAPRTSERQRVLAEVLDLTAPFPTEAGAKGPHLITPRPHLRIVPGKLGGSPHVRRTRVETQALAALVRRGATEENVYRLYPALDPAAIGDALDLEQQLARNLGVAA